MYWVKALKENIYTDMLKVFKEIYIHICKSI